uniref:Ribosomal protein L20 n=1 Tax=Reclinomonas americana TaxID=48483 RepID=O21274_RECAM|nr:ribosomal protein L20 [Reclinomonas americana]AAD11901.1 ribosomal protein L20 [Reclinomonas americana]
MIRVKSGTTTHSRHKKIIKNATGYRGRSKNCFSIAIEKVHKGLQYAYAHRKVNKRFFRNVWIQRINAACTTSQINYSSFIHNLSLQNIQLNRKILSTLAITEPYTFQSILKTINT